MMNQTQSTDHPTAKANANLYARFRAAFPADVNSVLLQTPEGRSVTYQDADTLSARLANTLTLAGAQPGDRVTVQVEKSVENLLLYLACLRAGLVYHPLNPAYQPAEVAYFLGDAQPAVVICDAKGLEAMKVLINGNPAIALLTLNRDGSGALMESAESASTSHEIVRREPNDLAALIYSSGTTGKPKGIMLSCDNLYSNIATMVEVWGFTAEDTLLHALPIYHVHGLFIAIGCALLSGSRMLWLDTFSDDAVIDAMPKATAMMGVPTYYTRLLSNPGLTPERCASMRVFISGSAPLLSETFHAFAKRSGHQILERYGMSETGMNTSNPLHGQRRPGTVGKALPGITVRIVDDAGNPTPIDEPGNLQVKGPNVFNGYWRMPEKTAEDFTDDGFFDTGDIATIDPDGYVSIVGRAKDMVISGGLNIYPVEVEAVIDDLTGVLESAVIGTPHDDFGEQVVAIVVLESGTDTSPIDAASVLAHCRSQLANFKIPKRVEFIAALPRNAMGKVQKKVLREQFGAKR